MSQAEVWSQFSRATRNLRRFSRVSARLAAPPCHRVYVLESGGDDYIRALAGDDLLGGGAGDDVVRGGGGNDKIYPGEGPDIVLAGAGNDKIYARDTNSLDTIDCGGGFDKVETIHRDDRTLDNCERTPGPRRGNI
jgi:hypothetical protein